jgi:hypothetical protein
MWTNNYWSANYWATTYWTTVVPGPVTEVTLYADTLAGNTWLRDGDQVAAEYCVTFLASATASRRVLFYVDGVNVFDSGASVYPSGGAADVWATLIRESSSVLRVRTSYVPSGISLQTENSYQRLTGLDLTTPKELKLTGIADGTGASPTDITGVIGTAQYTSGA